MKQAMPIKGVDTTTGTVNEHSGFAHEKNSEIDSAVESGLKRKPVDEDLMSHQPGKQNSK